jgi:hypothetical protein
MTEETNEFRQWAILELFGHRQIAGLVSEQNIADGPFVRVDVPATKASDAYTKFFNASAIYAITPCSEEAATIAATQLQIRPVNEWVVPNRQLPAPGATTQESELDYYNDPDYDDRIDF